MQLMFEGGKPRAACAIVLMLTIAGCGKGNAAGGPSSPTDGDAHAAKTDGYILVTHTRPEAPENYFHRERLAYTACVAVAKQLHHAVVPFPALPPDFVTERTTYASDGKRTMVREVKFDLDPRKMVPESSCELRLAKTWTTGLTGSGEVRSGGVDQDGQVRVVTTEAPPAEPVRASLLASRTVSKRINGVPLKCNTGGDCIVDPAVTVVAQGVRPVLAAYRIDDPATYGTALIVEPVSLTVGKPTDPAMFAVEKGE